MQTYKEKPLISIIIPTYNRLSLLKDTLNSIISQITKDPVEVIVVDDGSEDGTWDYLNELNKNFPFLKIFRHNSNKGPGSARNTGLSLAKGKYVFFFDSDDLLLKGALEKLLHFAKENKEEIYVFNSFREKKGKNKFILFPLEPSPLKRLKFLFEGAYSESLFLVKREIAIKHPFPEDLRVREDFYVKAKWLTLYKIKIINEPIAFYRDHSLRLRKQSKYYFEGALTSVEKLFKELPSEFQALYPYALYLTYLELAKRAYQIKDYTLSLNYLREAQKVYPQSLTKFKFLKLLLKSWCRSKFL